MRHSPIWVLLFVVLCLAACAQAEDEKPVVITIDAAGELAIGGLRVEKQTSTRVLHKALGEPSRTRESKVHETALYDERGVTTSRRLGASFHGSLTLKLGEGPRMGPGPRAKRPYTGVLEVAGTRIDATTQMATLEEAGFEDLFLTLLGGKEFKTQFLDPMGVRMLRRACGRTTVTLVFNAKQGHLQTMEIQLPWHLDPARAAIQEQAVTGDLEGVRASIQGGADAAVKDTHGRTLLHLAAMHGQADVVGYLLEKGAAVGIEDAAGASPLHAAGARHEWLPTGQHEGVAMIPPCGGAHAEAARLLLARGADPNARDQSRETPLHAAATSGNLGVARLLIEAKAIVDARTEYDVTPLTKAAEGGGVGDMLAFGGRVRRLEGEHAAVATLLLKHGADPNGPPGFGGSPLGTAAENGEREIARILMAAGADPGATGPDGRGPARHPPFFLAARHGHVDILRDMVSFDTAPGVLRDGGRRTPLHAAAAGGSVEATRFLLEAGLDVNARDAVGETPAHAAAGSVVAGLPVLKLLLAHGADLKVVDQEKRGLIHALAESCRNGEEELAFLVGHGLDVNLKDAAGRTPLQIARDVDCLIAGQPMVEPLRKHGAR